VIKFKLLYEIAYRGNIGIHELMKFYDIATEEQKRQIEAYLEAQDFENALILLRDVTGVMLNPN